MECLVCNQNVEPGELVLVVASATYDGPFDSDFTYRMASDDLGGVMHQKCLRNSAAVVKIDSGPVREELVVRSDALGLLSGV